MDTRTGLGKSHREGKGTIALFVTRGVRAPSSTVSWRPPRPRLRFPALCNPPLSVHPIRNPECFLLSPKIMTQKAKNPVEIKEVSDWGHPPVGKHPRPHLSQLFIGRQNTHLEARREKYVLPHIHFFKESTTFPPHFAAIIFSGISIRKCSQHKSFRNHPCLKNTIGYKFTFVPHFASLPLNAGLECFQSN